MLGLLAATLLLGGCTGQHTTRTAASTTYTPHIKASSQDVLDGAINADEPGCSAAVGVEGKVIWSGVRGIADLASGAKITTDTVFDIASTASSRNATSRAGMPSSGSSTIIGRDTTNSPPPTTASVARISSGLARTRCRYASTRASAASRVEVGLMTSAGSMTAPSVPASTPSGRLCRGWFGSDSSGARLRTRVRPMRGRASYAR